MFLFYTKNPDFEQLVGKSEGSYQKSVENNHFFELFEKKILKIEFFILNIKV